MDELVAAANTLLPEFLPAARDRPGSAGRCARRSTSAWCATILGQGLLDENTREGRESRYGFRHLLQLLLVRRLLIEGYPAAVIAKLIAGKDDAELRALLQGGTSVSATPANPALDFLARVRRRAGCPILPATAACWSRPRAVHLPAARRARPARRGRGTAPDFCPVWKSTSATASLCPPARTTRTLWAKFSSTPSKRSPVPPSHPAPSTTQLLMKPTPAAPPPRDEFHSPGFPPGPPRPAPGRTDRTRSSRARPRPGVPDEELRPRASAAQPRARLDRSGFMAGQKLELGPAGRRLRRGPTPGRGSGQRRGLRRPGGTRRRLDDRR